MLEVQKYLRSGNTFDDLTREYAIRVTKHPTLPLAIMNYCQLDSPKVNPITRECRALVLNSQDFSLISKSFNRFFNWGEVVEEMKLFDFSNCSIQSKEDGSLCHIFNFQGQWFANTRGSFALDQMEPHPFTWREAICRALGVTNLSELDGRLDPTLSYICEFVSPWNKVVRAYPDPKMYLLTVFDGYEELTPDEADGEILVSGAFVRPDRYNFTSIEEVQEFLRQQAESDPTYEGVVIRDCNNLRYKVKSPSYLSLHRLKNNGQLKKSDLYAMVVAGETEEFLTYFNEFAEVIAEIRGKVDQAYDELLKVWEETRHIEDQKTFAQAIIPRTKFASILFSARKTGSDPAMIWRTSDGLISKILD